MAQQDNIRLGTKSTSHGEYLFKKHRPAGSTGWTVLAALVVAMLGVQGFLWFEHHRIAGYFDGVFGPALGLRSSVLHADRDIAFARLAKRVEEQMGDLAQEVSLAYFAPPSPCTIDPSFAISDTLITTQLGDRIPAIQDSLFGWALVAKVGHYKLTSAVDIASLGSRGQRVADDTLQCRFARVAAALDSAYGRFPYDRRPTTWRMGTSIWNYECYDSTRTLPAFLYGGFPVQSPAIATQGLRKQIREAHEYAFTQCREQDRKMKILSREFCNINFPDSLWYRRLYAYVGFPATRLPQDYYPGARKWFQDTIRAQHVKWSPQYGDIGTGMPIVTCSVPVRTPKEEVAGVLAVDLRAMSLAQWKQDGRPYFANLWFLFVIAVVLWGILHVTGTWNHFSYILYAIISLFAFYLLMSFDWIWNPEGGTVRWIVNRLETVASVINSFFFVFAAAHLRGHSPSQSLSDRILRHFKTLSSEYGRTTQFLVAVLSSIALALISWVATALVAGHSGWGGIYPHEVVEAGIGMIALLVFGQRFAVWVSHVTPTGGPVWYIVVILAFLTYGVMQLAFPRFGHSPTYYWVLFVGKACLLLLVCWWIFYYTQIYNSLKRQLGKIVAKIYSRSVAEGFLVLIGKQVGTATVLLACNSVAAWKLCLESDPAKREIVPSILGESNMLEPRGYSLDEILAPGEVVRIGRHLMASPLKAGVRVLEHVTVSLRALDGTIIPILFDRIAAWEDVHTQDHANSPQVYVVGIGSTPSHATN